MERRIVTVHGTVQGVGFRPFVHRLAGQLRIGGLIRNRAGSVHIEIEGERSALDSFCRDLLDRAPPLARVENVSWREDRCRGERQFRIEPSDTAQNGSIAITPDAVTCDECLAEVLDPTERRYGYPFTNCTNCGPRLTISTGSPYDRERTTMASFAFCDACRAEYEDPSDRRFHAQPIACPECGPRLSLLGRSGIAIATHRPLELFVEAVRAGQIGALKGLGGYHLVCDASPEEVVAKLRRRKHRESRPFAIMLAGVAEVERFCELAPPERSSVPSRRMFAMERLSASSRAASIQRSWSSSRPPARRSGKTRTCRKLS